MTRIVSKHWFDYSNRALNEIEQTKDLLRSAIAYFQQKGCAWVGTRDARSNLLVGIKKVLQSTQMSYLNMRFCMVDHEYWRRFVKEYKASEIPEHIKEYNVLILTGWIYGVSTVVEESSRLLLRALKPGACSDATSEFKSIYDCLFAELGMKSAVPLFDLFRLVRNCIHTNGVYYPASRKDAEVTVDGETFRFTVGQKLAFVDFPFISRLVGKLVITLRQLLDDDRLLAISMIERIG